MTLTNIRQKNVLNEKQELRFHDKNIREQLLTYVNAIRSGGDQDTIVNNLANILYAVISGNKLAGVAPSRKMMIQIGSDWQRSFENERFWGTHPVWAARRHEPLDNVDSEPNNILYNIYVTFEKTPENLLLVSKKIYLLDKLLEKFSEEFKTNVYFKIHKTLTGMVNHNDSMKIYFENPKHRQRIFQIVEQWLKTTGIQNSERTHVHGYDDETPGARSSYGAILAKACAKKIFFSVQETSKTKTAEEQVDWIATFSPAFFRTHSEVTTAHPYLIKI